MASSKGSENVTDQFTKEAVQELLNDDPISKKPDLKRMTHQNKRLKLCVKWFQQVDETHLLEQERLRNSLVSAEKKCMDTELETEKKLGELDEILAQSRKNCCDLRNKLANEKATRRAVSDSLTKEKNGAVQEIVDSLRKKNEVAVQALVDSLWKEKEAAAQAEERRPACTQGMRSSELKQIEMLTHQLAAANEKLKMADLSAVEMRMQFDGQKRKISELQGCLSTVELQLVKGEELRKKQNNTILELKGNIRVFCRVRPLLSGDGLGSESLISYPTSMGNVGQRILLRQDGTAEKRYQFQFDKVFTHEASQQDVFLEISELVQSALDGYKVCIFAYGQTGSGKTHTMFGKSDVPEQKGLIPRSLEQIFESCQTIMARGWKYRLEACMLEIYNDDIRDLLLPSGFTGREHPIKHDENGDAYVANLTKVDIHNMKEITSLLEQAAQRRAVETTLMNEQSSRSHSVFTLQIIGVNESTGQELKGALNLIDLAGSERASTSGATGERLVETKAINQSLSHLGDVMNALSKKLAHIPFRNSKLTRILQPYLGGHSKTLMFVNISPESSSASESLMSLRFAERVKSCDIRMPRQSPMPPTDSRSFVRPYSQRPMHGRDFTTSVRRPDLQRKEP